MRVNISNVFFPGHHKLLLSLSHVASMAKKGYIYLHAALGFKTLEKMHFVIIVEFCVTYLISKSAKYFKPFPKFSTYS